MAGWMVSNLVTVTLLLGCAVLGRFVATNPLWLEAARSLWRRRPIALLVILVYVALGAADSIRWKGSVGAGEDVVAAHEARSLLDRAFAGSRERSYSAPLASTEFYDDDIVLSYPGSHLLGTDILGRDVFYLTLKGSRVALLIGGLTSLIAIPLALLMGVSAGYFGRRIDVVVFFVISTLASMPGLLLLIAMIMVMGRGTLSVCIALGVTSWIGLCRISRGETFKLREMDYVRAAHALGVSHGRIIVRHILPNLAHLIVITFVLLFSGLVLSEAILSWLGIGVDGSWGQMVDQARDELSRDPIVWWNLGAAGLALFGLLLAVNFVGDAVRDVLDPRTLRENT